MPTWSADYWRRSPVAREVGEREGVGLSQNGGTPRHPRTARKAARKENYRHGQFVGAFPDAEGQALHLTRRLIAAGYYDEYRRAFEAADE